MTDFRIRTEDLRDDEILAMYVQTTQDKHIVDRLKAPTPVIVEGSRGTGKSFLLRVAEAELWRDFETDRVLPVYISFIKSSLVHTSDSAQFHHWMLARLCARLLRVLYRKGWLAKSHASISILAGGNEPANANESKLAILADQYEESYKTPGISVDTSAILPVENFKDAIEDLCEDFKLKRVALFFDEAAHIFRPDQQRQFFTLFRDLRSPFISCNAAVYPGVTSYGPTFQASHDATIIQINKELGDPEYLSNMRGMVFKQADSDLMANIERHGENFDALAYAVSGNPRLLLKTIAKAGNLRTDKVNSTLKDFYRTEIWSEHSGLVDRYEGHRPLIDWGRTFVENHVIPNLRVKNEQWQKEGKPERSCFFWVHRDAPEAVHESLRLLEYTGIVSKRDGGVAATRSEIGNRYAVNIGCLAAMDANPIAYIKELRRQITIKRFTEYGANAQPFASLPDIATQLKEKETTLLLAAQLKKSIRVLDISNWQMAGLERIGLDTIGKALRADEGAYQEIRYVGPKRARNIRNEVVASILEYLSG